MGLAFERQTPRAPVAIADMEVQLFYPEPGSGGVASARYSVQVRDDQGGLRVLEGDLTPYLAQGEIEALLDFMASLRGRAIAEILPTPLEE